MAGLVQAAADKSNHSLCATSISRLYSAGVPEKLIMERSGHLSKEGVRGYERNSEQQDKAMSDLLSDPKATYAESLKPAEQPLVDNTQSPERAPLRDIPPNSTKTVEKGQAKVKEMFALSGCNVTFNMHF